MKYAERGKGSKAWWMQAVKQFGVGGYRGIFLNTKAPIHEVRAAVQELETEGIVYSEGEAGKGRQQKFFLSNAGERALSESAEGQIPAATDRPPVYTWKRAMGNGIRYFRDNVRVSATDVPEEELARILVETKQGITQSPKAAISSNAPTPPSGKDTYTWERPIVGPVRYFKNGEFILETRIPLGELTRMQHEQQDGQPEPVVRSVPEPAGNKEFPKLEVSEPLDPKPSKVPKLVVRPIDKVVEKAVDLGQAIEQHHAASPATVISETGSGVILRHDDPPPKPTIRPSEPLAKQLIPDPPQLVAATPKSVIRAEFKAAFQDVLVEILLERYADQVTAAEVMQRLERQYE